MNCDRIAPFYEFFERTAFGGNLQKHREMYMSAAAGKRRVLILGDGDGRFTEALIRNHPALEVESVEMSAGMVRQARKRLGERANFTVIQRDVFECAFAADSYDVIFSHFFLDCFEAEKLTELIGMLAAALRPEGVWIVSDFRQAGSGWRRLHSRVWLAVMYFFFRMTTGLTTKRLPDYYSVLEAAGFRKQRESASFGGLICSEWWQSQRSKA